jgi:protein CpxP
MKKNTMKVAMLAAASFGWISLAAAQGPEGGHMRRPGGPGFGPGGGPGGPGGPPMGPPMGMIAEHLGLTDDQKAQWKEIHEKARESGEPLLKAAGAAKEAFDKALEAENADASTVGQAAIAMRNAHRAVGAHHKATFDAVKAILTPEQLAKFEEMEKHRGPGPNGFGPGGHQGGPQGGRPGGGPQGQGPQRRKGPGGSK